MAEMSAIFSNAGRGSKLLVPRKLLRHSCNNLLVPNVGFRNSVLQLQHKSRSRLLFVLGFIGAIRSSLQRRSQRQSRSSSVKVRRRQAAQTKSEDKGCNEPEVFDLVDRILADAVLNSMDDIAGSRMETRGFDGFVAHAVAKRNLCASDRQNYGVEVLKGAIPGPIALASKTLFTSIRQSPWPEALLPIARALLSLVGPNVGRWLVGHSRILNLKEEDEVLRRPTFSLPPAGGDESSGAPILLIEKCKFLEAVGGCKGLCMNMCKAATEQYLAEEMALPVYMDPNLEDYSCRMVFMRSALPPQNDPAYAQCCKAERCDGGFEFPCSQACEVPCLQDSASAEEIKQNGDLIVREDGFET
eukprot:TRINITY_DN110009_c0_g1_i1.p1 TRINITY_DN110009_c0_g1~~TRINITY_DN110009_c0_g1_i1.p1  ORF type:complete len:366 (+),score=47.08 TRINITY_DN110009_c0_g1_i1:27-1100(+)